MSTTSAHICVTANHFHRDGSSVVGPEADLVGLLAVKCSILTPEDMSFGRLEPFYRDIKCCRIFRMRSKRRRINILFHSFGKGDPVPT